LEAQKNVSNFVSADHNNPTAASSHLKIVENWPNTSKNWKNALEIMSELKSKAQALRHFKVALVVM